jgi:hypothetical protein
MAPTNPNSLTDRELLSETRRAAGSERQATAALISLLAEVDSRRLYLGEGYSSMFAYCTRALLLSEQAAYARIEASRLCRRFPTVLTGLIGGSLTLTTVGLLAPHLTDDNWEQLVDAASGKSKREIEFLVAAIHPQPAIPSSIRALPLPRAALTAPGSGSRSGLTNSLTPVSEAVEEARSSDSPAAPETKTPAHRQAIAPVSSRQYLLRVTISADTQHKLDRARDLLRHQIPGGDLAQIIDRALTVLVEQAERAKFASLKSDGSPRSRQAAQARPERRSRRIPAAVRRTVWARDGGRCAFVGRNGKCGETGFLEFHHRVPWALGGQNSVDNIELQCRAHNAHEARIAGLDPPSRGF